MTPSMPSSTNSEWRCMTARPPSLPGAGRRSFLTSIWGEMERSRVAVSALSPCRGRAVALASAARHALSQLPARARAHGSDRVSGSDETGGSPHPYRAPMDAGPDAVMFQRLCKSREECELLGQAHAADRSYRINVLGTTRFLEFGG